MIEKEIYSPDAFLKILKHNGVDCDFEKCVLYPDYVTYQFRLKEDAKLTEFQIYSVTFSVIVESENSCFFIGKKDKVLIFLLTFINDLKKFGLSKTKETLGVIPKRTYAFDYVKGSLEKLVWYKFDTKELANNKLLQEFGGEVTSAEERVLLDTFWSEVTSG